MTPSKTISTPQIDQNLKKIDELFLSAGLVRSRRSTNHRRATRVNDRPGSEGAGRDDAVRTPEPSPFTAENGVGLLQVPDWLGNPKLRSWLWHGFSTRVGGLSRSYCSADAPGELNLGFTEADSRQAVLGNRRLLAQAVTGDAATPIATSRQFHSNLVRIAWANDLERQSPPKADGIITSAPGLLLAVQTADCIPVLVADRRQRVVGAFHAGWRGTAKRIVESGVGRMRLEFDCRAQDLTAAIGPGNLRCCYSVGEELLFEFESQFGYARELFSEVFDSDSVRRKYPMLFLTQHAPGHSSTGPELHLDLIEANRRQLLDAGISAKDIFVTGGCTNCRPGLFFSHRSSRGHTGRMMSVIGVRPGNKSKAAA